MTEAEAEVIKHRVLACSLNPHPLSSSPTTPSSQSIKRIITFIIIDFRYFLLILYTFPFYT